ncbi:ABC transporter transmembrane domain-containing protein [Cyanobium sp. FGCU-6]|nr:ABC transporter transmembrane domain-containing protein [Cyanobium sp. FGCU6]
MTQATPNPTPPSGVDAGTLNLRQLPAFAGLSEAGEARLIRELQLVRFRIGQNLTEASALPAQVFILLQGQCRLLGIEQGRLASLARLGPGNVIGLASLLRAEPCEAITAATEVVAAALPDRLIVELYGQEESFRRWCNQMLWPSEVAALLELLQQKAAQSDRSLRNNLAPLLQQAQLISSEALVDPLALRAAAQGHRLFLASANAGGRIGDPINPELPLPRAQPPFGLRVISLPDGLGSTAAASIPAVSPNALELAAPAIAPAPELPERSGLDLGQGDGLAGFRLIRGEGPLEETLACFQMMAAQLKLPFRRDSIEKVLRDSLRRGQSPNIQLCGQLGASLGLHVVNAKLPAAMGTRLQTPAMLQWNGGFALAVASDSTGLLLASPRRGQVRLRPAQLEESFPEGIDLLLMDRAVNTPEQRFGPGWFWPALRRYRGVLLQVLLASFVVQLFGLANPLLIQVIIDKVISQRSIDTLQVLGIGLVVVTLLEGVLGSLRTFLFAETTNRIDQRLGAEVIDHLLRLPLGYFDRRPVGELGSRIAELEKIRNFLTGTALTTVLDAAFSVIYIVVMALYSWVLTIVALAVLPIQVGLTVIGAPLFRRQFRQAAEENAQTQSHLVEVLTGIQTVKAQNVEMVSRWKWQELYSRFIARTFEKTVTGTALNETSQVLQKLSQLLVLWVGAAMVLKGELTLGQLIAFRIISGYVTQPLLRLSGIWQSIQELRVSFERLADVIDTPLESNLSDQAKIPLPPIAGRVEFDAVTFAFQPGAAPVLKSINLLVEPGTFVGIVGQSGSGKSTLMKLLPRLYSPDSGRVLIDGYDIDKVELYSLRRQIGIVPQDPLLFSGTVAENIALTRPEADSEEIVRAARLACAHDFIMELPLGYSTPVGERGGSLSGGQRQRVAIARTLLSNPKLLVMDEATSALDYETERRVCENLLESLHDCTVFFITHRLSTIRRAQRVVMMHQGAIVETGSHESLMAERGRYYALYRQQEAS